MEALEVLYGTSEEDGHLSNNFQKYQYSTFEKGRCENHRNAIQLFTFDEKYFVVSKTFNHDQKSSRLQMKIHTFTPSEDGERGSIYECHSVDWPIVDSAACFDPAMISVVQFQESLYYFKIQNQLEENTGDSKDVDCDIVFKLFKFSMEDEEETLVHDYKYSWPKTLPGAGDDLASEAGSNMSHLERRMSAQFTSKKYALNAVFIDLDTFGCENEEEFIQKQMVALLFENGEGRPDEKFVYKIRKLALWNVDLFTEKTPMACSGQFKF